MQGIQEGLVTRGQDVSVAAGEISALCNQREPVLEVHTSPLSCFQDMETLQSQAKLQSHSLQNEPPMIHILS